MNAVTAAAAHVENAHSPLLLQILTTICRLYLFVQTEAV